MKKQLLLLLLKTSTLVLSLPASGGNFDMRSNWWEGTDIGVSGQYLTTKFKDAVVEPAFRTIVNTLDKIPLKSRHLMIMMNSSRLPTYSLY